MKINLLRFFVLILLTLMYLGLYYYQFTLQILIDYTSFYEASKALKLGINPYQVLSTTFTSIPKKIPTNLNPPAVLWALQPFTYLPYKLGLAIWDVLSLMAQIVAAQIAYQQLRQSKKNPVSVFNYWLVVFALFPIIMNTTIAQVGAFIAFFVYLGYQQWQKERYIWAGILWGIISAFKLFPLLLILYPITFKQYKTVISFLLSFIVLSLIPLHMTTMDTYINYALLVKKVFWYGDNWNASFYGYLFRLFVDGNNIYQNITWLKLTYVISLLLLSSFTFYYCRLSVRSAQSQDSQHLFNVLIITMLWLSPFGWLYYFQLLLLPGLSLYETIKKPQPYAIITLSNLSFFMLLTPIVYVTATHFQSWLSCISYYSCHFYGLTLLLYLTIKTQNTSNSTHVQIIDIDLDKRLTFMLFIGLTVPYYYLIKAYMGWL